MSKENKNTSRRQFLKKTALGSVVLASPLEAAPTAMTADRLQVLSALGDTLIPSAPGKPGFRSMEPHGITAQTNKSLRALEDDLFAEFNQASQDFFQDRTFLELGEEERAQFLRKVINGEEFADKMLHQRVRRVYRLVRIAVFRIFYSNFPDHKIVRNTQGVPVLKPGDLHQITVPDTQNLTTGWDIAGYRGPLRWEQEEKMRAEMRQNHWHDDLEDLVVRYRPKPSPD
ncbi:MAG: twin-arginine translocation signal domain-containing protein [Acidobacteria bacterium]|nr:twin-arginine translocation signal domain-containing protein [Acidobacteriota bacterium]